jgi:hypothetical protein
MKYIQLKNGKEYIKYYEQCPFLDDCECPLNKYKFCGDTGDFPDWYPLCEDGESK